MRLTCIGTGTAVPEADRVCSGYLLETHAVRLLMDCGGGVVHAMARSGIAWRELTHIAITHFHNDHIGDLPLLFFAWKWGMSPARAQPLTLIGPRGTKNLLNRMAGTFGSHLDDPGFAVEVVELEAGRTLRLDDSVRLRAARTPHTDESVAYRIDADTRSFCFTGDTGMSGDVAIFGQAVDALLIECSLPDEQAADVHLTPSGVAEMARIALPKRLLVTHVYPHTGRADLATRIREAGWPGEVQVMADGDVVDIGA